MQDLLGVGTGAPGIQELVDARTLESSVIRPAFTTVDDESAVEASDSTASDASNAANVTETVRLLIFASFLHHSLWEMNR